MDQVTCQEGWSKVEKSKWVGTLPGGWKLQEFGMVCMGRE